MEKLQSAQFIKEKKDLSWNKVLNLSNNIVKKNE